MRGFFLILALLLGLAQAGAVQPGEQLRDAGQEARARQLSAQLRCLVCQNQSIDDSDAALARDLRLLVRERIMAGDDDAAIRAFLVERFGAFILLKPQMTWNTALLWGLPLLALGLGGVAALSLFRKRREEIAPLTPEEEARVAALLGEHPLK